MFLYTQNFFKIFFGVFYYFTSTKGSFQYFEMFLKYLVVDAGTVNLIPLNSCYLTWIYVQSPFPFPKHRNGIQILKLIPYFLC